MLLFGYHKEFIFEERGFFEISENKNPLKITRYMVAHSQHYQLYMYTLLVACLAQPGTWRGF